MKVPIITKQEVDLHIRYVLRGIRGGIGEVKKVVAEREFDNEPTLSDVAKFITETGCDFASVAINYMVVKDDDLPFL